MNRRTFVSTAPLATAMLCLLGTLACSEYNLAPLPGYLGKEFLAVDLNNYDGSATEESADAAQFSVTVSNPTFSGGEADVTISQRGGDEAVAREDIEPGDLETFDLPRWDAEDSFKGPRAFYVESDVPVTAHQFNPANNVGVYSNDASMLIPLHSLGTRYRAACWPHDGVSAGYADYITVVASESGTEVSIVPSANVAAGDGVPAVQAGATLDVTLEKYEVLQVESVLQNGVANDLTGSLITSNRPVAVFSGNECAQIPSGVAACDHIEEQLFPIEHWGKHYFVIKFEPRKTEKDLFRIIADKAGTTVETTPALPGFPATLAAGEYVEFEHDADFEVEASEPVAVTQYMTGSQYCGQDPVAIGDPAMLVVLPEEQYIDEYIFLTPNNYLFDYVNIIADEDTEVTLDDDEVDSDEFKDIPSSDWKRARIELDPGVHHIKATRPVGVIVYGYDDDVSYAYPGGAELQPLSQE